MISVIAWLEARGLAANAVVGVLSRKFNVSTELNLCGFPRLPARVDSSAFGR
jgi:hypothetical protein